MNLEPLPWPKRTVPLQCQSHTRFAVVEQLCAAVADPIAFNANTPEPMQLRTRLASPFIPDAHGALPFSGLLQQLYAGEQQESKSRSA